MQQIAWVALGYNAPATPSKNRVYVWRKLKDCGAEYFRPGVAILPNNQANMAQFRALEARIKDMGGDAVIVELKFCDVRDEAGMVAQFKRHAENEYRALMSDGKQLSSLTPVQRDELLKKLMKRYGKVKSRDFFRSRDSVSQGLIDLADDMERVAVDFGRQLRNLLDFY